MAKLALLKPRLGMRRIKGIWPPSNPMRTELPERAVWPLPPRPLVLPWPLDSPWPRRLRRCLAPGRGLRSCRRIKIRRWRAVELPRQAEPAVEAEQEPESALARQPQAEPERPVSRQRRPEPFGASLPFRALYKYFRVCAGAADLPWWL